MITPSPASAPTPAPTASVSPSPASEPVLLLLFVPDETGEELTAVDAEGEDSPQGLISALVAAGALPDVDYGNRITCSVADEQLNYEDLTYVGTFVHLDLSDAFAQAVRQAGAGKERLMLQSLVNTFIAHYGADALVLSIEGTDLETVNGRYDRPIAMNELAKTRASDYPVP